MASIEYFSKNDHTVANGGTVVVEVNRPIRFYNSTLAKVSGGNVTAITMARSLDGGTTYGPERTVTLAAALSTAGDAVDADLVDECPTHVRYTFSLSASTVVKIVARGVG